MRARSGYLRWIELDEAGVDLDRYPFTLPVVAGLRATGRLHLDPGVTFLVGDNGAGKSTLVEAVAVAAGFNPEGGTRNFRFTTRASESSLGAHLRLVRGVSKPRTGFFLRAESYYNTATEIERLDREVPRGPGVPGFAEFGGHNPHERSHGESFIDLAVHRFSPEGLYLLDEPEAALSVHGCLAVLARIRELVAAGSQFLVATHSPILLALPGATILQIGTDGTIEQVAYDDAQPVVLTRSFLADPALFLRHLWG